MSDTAVSPDTGALQLSQVIDGAEVPSDTGETFESRDPHDGSLVAVGPRGGTADAARAISAARTAFDDDRWPQTAPKERAGSCGRSLTYSIVTTRARLAGDA